MTRNKILFLLIFSPLFINAQHTINNPFEKENYFKIYSSTEKHTNIQPYFYPDSISSATTINISPFYQAQIGFEPQQKNISALFLAGPSININHKNKIFANFVAFGGLYTPDNFQPKLTDSLKLIPAVGNYNASKNSLNKYFNFSGSLIYKPQEFIYFEIGKGKTFLGDGYRSLLMSDNSISFPYFRTIVDIWKIKYLYQVSKMKGQDYRFSETDLYNKFVYSQYLSFNIGKRINFSLFETVIQSSYDSLLVKRGIEVNYLNPVIFLRSVEYNIGTFDNVLVGISGHLKIFKSGMLYGQVFIDEFILSHIKSSDEYWDEKYGIQAGIKFYNTLGIKNLFTQAELNAVRPYTYSHEYGIGSYTNNYQPIAHPLGSNFAEALGIIGYSYKNIYTQAKIVYSQYGENDTLNYGRNPQLPYTTRISDENINWFQGDKTNLKYAEIMFGYSKKQTISLTMAYRGINGTQNNRQNLILMLGISSPLFYNRYYDWN